MSLTRRCTICRNPLLRKMVDPMFDDGATAAAISRMFEEGAGAHVSPDVLNGHRKHYKDDRPPAGALPKGGRRTDLAVLIRDKVQDKIESADGDELEAILFSKAGQGAINTGLRAQVILDGREKEKAKTGRNVELLGALFAIVGLTPPPSVAGELDDPNVIDGEAVEVDGEAE